MACASMGCWCRLFCQRLDGALCGSQQEVSRSSCLGFSGGRCAAPHFYLVTAAVLAVGPLRCMQSHTQYLVVYSLAFLGGLAGVPFANYFSAFIRDDLHGSVGLSGEAWLTMGVAGAVGGVLFGTLGDKAGLSRALVAAMALLATSAIIVATRPVDALLILAAGCFGASFFSIFGLLPAYVGKTAEAALTPAICGVVECSLGLGGALGSLLGGMSPHLVGSFRPVYVSAGIISAVMIGLSSFLPRESDGPAAVSRAGQLPAKSGLYGDHCDN